LARIAKEGDTAYNLDTGKLLVTFTAEKGRKVTF
jgi:hypothetical protein